MSVIDVVDVSHAFGEGASRRKVLSGVTVSLTEKRIGVIGANGSGKSTFARLLNGLVVPTSGKVTVDGLSTARQGREVRKRVGFCFTDPDAQIVMPTVGEDVAFSLRSAGLAKVQVGEIVSRTLNEFGLEELVDHPSHLLSGGQKQLLALASVLVTEPSVLVMDEPTTLLDYRNARMITNVVQGLPQQVVLLTHHLDLLAGFERVLVFDRGALVFDGSPADAIDFYLRLMS